MCQILSRKVCHLLARGYLFAIIALAGTSNAASWPQLVKALRWTIPIGRVRGSVYNQIKECVVLYPRIFNKAHIFSKVVLL